MNLAPLTEDTISHEPDIIGSRQEPRYPEKTVVSLNNS